MALRAYKRRFLVWLLVCAATAVFTTYLCGTWTGERKDSVKSVQQEQQEKLMYVLRKSSSSMPWFMKEGLLQPTPAHIDEASGRRLANLWPEERADDRIVNQLMYIPPHQLDTTKSIYVGKMNAFHVTPGRSIFLDSGCPVHQCTIAESFKRADAVLFRDSIPFIRKADSLNQVWVLYVLENPLHSGTVVQRNSVNWTATYRTESDLVTPYEKWVYYDSKVRSRPQDKNYAATKTKKVAWFVSNCQAKNHRLQYAKELGKYIQVDIFGLCGDKKCPKKKGECAEMLKQEYKFYLSFENGNCRDYITEKFFVNGLGNNVLPVVMGAHPDDYKRIAPEHSYIHVDDFESPKDLAAYLHQLDKDDDLYNSYFQWKGTGEWINTYFFCRLCAMLHDSIRQQRVYSDFPGWWEGNHVCRKGAWIV